MVTEYNNDPFTISARRRKGENLSMQKLFVNEKQQRYMSVHVLIQHTVHLG